MTAPHIVGFLRGIFLPVLVGYLLGGCSTLKVPVNTPSFDADETYRSQVADIVLEAKPIKTRKRYWELFDEELPKIGIAAVWLRVRNLGDVAADLTGIDWKLRVGRKEYSALDTAGVFKRYYNRKRIRIYGVKADETARQELERIMFLPSPVKSGSSLEGFVFFKIDPQRAPEWSRGAILVASGFYLGPEDRTRIEINLSNAQPRR